MSNLLSRAVVAAAQSADDVESTLNGAFSPDAAAAESVEAMRDERRVRDALFVCSVSAYGMAGAAIDAKTSYETAHEAGGTDDEIKLAFRIGWIGRRAPDEIASAGDLAATFAWAALECKKAGADAKKANEHGQRTAETEAAYKAANVAASAARKALGLVDNSGKTGRKPRAAAPAAVIIPPAINEMVAPFCATPAEFCQWAAMRADYDLKCITQNAKLAGGAEGRIVAALMTIIRDAAEDVKTILDESKK